MLIFLCFVLKSSAKQNPGILKRLKPLFEGVGNVFPHKPKEKDYDHEYYNYNDDYDENDGDKVDEGLVEEMVEATIYRNGKNDAKKSCRKQCPIYRYMYFWKI